MTDKIVFLITYAIPVGAILWAALIGAFIIHWGLGIVFGFFWFWVWAGFYEQCSRALRNPEDPQ